MAEATRSMRKARPTFERGREGDPGASSSMARVVSGCAAPWCRLIVVAEVGGLGMTVHPGFGARRSALVVLKVVDPATISHPICEQTAAGRMLKLLTLGYASDMLRPVLVCLTHFSQVTIAY